MSVDPNACGQLFVAGAYRRVPENRSNNARQARAPNFNRGPASRRPHLNQTQTLDWVAVKELKLHSVTTKIWILHKSML